MKVVFLSNYFNHHQKPFCEEMYRRFGSDFAFISTMEMRDERKKLGYSQGDIPEYVLLSHINKEQHIKALGLINNADVVIVGKSPASMILMRILKGKLVFRYSERPFKKHVSKIRKLFHTINLHTKNLFSKEIYLLCASAYATLDYDSIGLYRNYTYKWGYFPNIKSYDVDDLMINKKSNMIVWCGRFIDWKHPDDAIFIAKKLKEAGYEFRLNMIGTGDMEDELKTLVKDNCLDSVVHFTGSMPPESVRAYMEEAGIYLFTSDRKEGWGAVLNESMNSGCAVVASHAIGSVPYLLENKKNGLIYKSGDLDSLYEKVEYLLGHPQEQKRLGISAYDTMRNTWNAQVAVERFIALAKQIMNGKKTPDLFNSGPCSKSKVIKDDWFDE